MSLIADVAAVYEANAVIAAEAEAETAGLRTECGRFCTSLAEQEAVTAAVAAAHEANLAELASVRAAFNTCVDDYNRTLRQRSCFLSGP
jgi:hypothetical protein